jgi:hypothetical protein
MSNYADSAYGDYRYDDPMSIYENQLEHKGWTNDDPIYYNPPLPELEIIPEQQHYDQPADFHHQQYQSYSEQPVPGDEMNFEDSGIFEQMPYSYDPHLNQSYNRHAQNTISAGTEFDNQVDRNETDPSNFWKRQALCKEVRFPTSFPVPLASDIF